MLLKEFALALTDRKQELYDLSKRAGATVRDSLSDVDGGIGVLFTYSSKGRRELPNARVYLDGPVEPLSKDGSFLGRHVYTRLPGVAVQINAFNFPMWGALEKFAPAFLAGVPSLVKPATPTAYVAEAWVRILVETGLLPEGSLQLVSGSVPASSTTSARRHRRLHRQRLDGRAAAALEAATGGVRFTSETDSINASVLGPDAVPGTPEFDAYVKQLMVELTTKAGQKCTAIRRAIVPAASVDALVEAVRAKIAERVVIGDPHAEAVTMGPLVSLEQRDEVLRQSRALEAAGGAHPARLDRRRPRSCAPTDRRGPRPTARSSSRSWSGFADAAAPAVHEIEAFGPVASVLAYSTIARGGRRSSTSAAGRS